MIGHDEMNSNWLLISTNYMHQLLSSYYNMLHICRPEFGAIVLLPGVCQLLEGCPGEVANLWGSISQTDTSTVLCSAWQPGDSTSHSSFSLVFSALFSSHFAILYVRLSPLPTSPPYTLLTSFSSVMSSVFPLTPSLILFSHSSSSSNPFRRTVIYF